MRKLQQPRRRHTVRYVVVGGIGTLVVVTVVLALGSGTPRMVTPRATTSQPTMSFDAQPARRETRPTLDPARFDGAAQRAYQVAREIPDVLDQLQCYCACRFQYGHVSLLSCYTDGHGST